MMLAVLLGYLAGSVPFAFLLARRAGIDVRVVGSGNVGAANVMRATGIGRAIAVMALDVAKGAAAVALAQLTSGGAALAAMSGTAAIVGHIYPVWLKISRRKGSSRGSRGVRRTCADGHSGRRGDVRRDGLGDPVCVSRIRGGDTGSSARSLADRRPCGCCERSLGKRGPDSLPSPNQPSTPARRNRTPDRRQARHAPRASRTLST